MLADRLELLLAAVPASRLTRHAGPAKYHASQSAAARWQLAHGKGASVTTSLTEPTQLHCACTVPD